MAAPGKIPVEVELRVVDRQPVPTVGRIVHYHSYGTPGGEYLPEPRAAIVTAVQEPTYYKSALSLCILNPTGMFFNELVSFSDEPKPGHWSWPPRV